MKFFESVSVENKSMFFRLVMYKNQNVMFEHRIDYSILYAITCMDLNSKLSHFFPKHLSKLYSVKSSEQWTKILFWSVEATVWIYFQL